MARTSEHHSADPSTSMDAFAGVAPGKRSMTSSMGVQRKAGSTTSAAPAPARATPSAGAHDDPFGLHLDTVQRATVAPSGASDAEVHGAARHGTSGAGGALPHLAAIQRSFGAHDVTGVRGHTDGAAAEGTAAMGARAFASGNDVAFAPGAADLHTAAHEAAHVVQQRAGVHLAGGVGAEGDAYERHADAVADMVVAGESAEALLGAGPGGASASAAVQRKPGGGWKKMLTPDANAEGIGLTAARYLGRHAVKGVKATGKAIASAARNVSEGVSGLFDDDGADAGQQGQGQQPAQDQPPVDPEAAQKTFVQMYAGRPEGAYDYHLGIAQRELASKVYAPYKQRYLDAGMTETDITWVLCYTGAASYAINAILRGLITDPVWLQSYSPMIEPITAALAKIPPGMRNQAFQSSEDHSEPKKLDASKGADDLITVTKLHRLDNLNEHFAPAFLRDYAKGSTVNEPGFLSMTAFAGSYGGGATQTVSREIETPADLGKAVSTMSSKAHENEVLVPPGAQMRIDSITRTDPDPGPVNAPRDVYPTAKDVIGHTFHVKATLVAVPHDVKPSDNAQDPAASKKGDTQADALGQRLGSANHLV